MKKFSNAMAAIALAICMVGGGYLTSCSNSSDSGSNATYIGTKAPNLAKAVGDIVFSDGSASAYTETLTDAQKTAAVAVIFDASNKLGVGLETASRKAWCENSANANNVGTYATSESDGKANTNEITALSDYSEANYPAFYFAASYSATGFTSGWYLPAKTELQALYDAKSTVEAAFTALEKSAPFSSNNNWWSSSQSDSVDNAAYRLNFASGAWGSDINHRKMYAGCVCAVRAFN